MATVLLVALFLGWLIGLRYPFFPERGERLLLLALPAFVMLVAAAGWPYGPAPHGRWVGYLGLGLFVVVSVSQPGGLLHRPTLPRRRLPAADRAVGRAGAPGDTVFAIYPWQVGYWRSYAAGPRAAGRPDARG